MRASIIASRLFCPRAPGALCGAAAADRWQGQGESARQRGALATAAGLRSAAVSQLAQQLAEVAVPFRTQIWRVVSFGAHNAPGAPGVGGGGGGYSLRPPALRCGSAWLGLPILRDTRASSLTNAPPLSLCSPSRSPTSRPSSRWLAARMPSVRVIPPPPPPPALSLDAPAVADAPFPVDCSSHQRPA
jgi:hypothetical protein